MAELVNVFWTSGLDSTCRIVELASAEGFKIQPWYLREKSRRSSGIETEHIKKMTGLIRGNPATRSELLDTEIVDVDDIRIPEDISGCYGQIARCYLIGSQYEWISAFLNDRNMVAQIAAEAPRTGIVTALLGEGRLVREGDGVGAVLRPDPASLTEKGRILFRNYALPYGIWNMFKLDEAAEMKTLGYGDVFDLTWFCHRPVFGMPCGHCNPCKDAIRDGFGYRIPAAGRLLYPLDRFFRHSIHVLNDR